MSGSREYLIEALGNALTGHDAALSSLDMSIPDPCGLNNIERAAWLALKNWQIDGKIRSEIPACDKLCRLRLSELLIRLKEDIGADVDTAFIWRRKPSLH